jgi:uncharacterized protein with HEPN domain
MQPEGRDADLLRDMRSYAREVVELVQGFEPQEFADDLRTRRAVQYSLLAIGEAASRVSKHFQLATPHIAWRRIIDQRHVLAHHYDAVRFDVLWLTATRATAELITQIDALLGDEPDIA